MIDQLIQQARAMVHDEAGIAPFPQSMIEQESDQLLARLILEQCIQLAVDRHRHDIVVAIKQHFDI